MGGGPANSVWRGLDPSGFGQGSVDIICCFRLKIRVRENIVAECGLTKIGAVGSSSSTECSTLARLLPIVRACLNCECATDTFRQNGRDLWCCVATIAR